MRPLAIAYLLPTTTHLSGAVQTVFRTADSLVAMGHQVTLYAPAAGVDWPTTRASVEVVTTFERSALRPHDLVVSTCYTTIEEARLSGIGHPAHLCQGYEGDSPRLAEELLWIETAYQLEGVAHLCTSPTLRMRLQERFGIAAHTVPFGVDINHFRPERPRPGTGPLRVILVGPWEVPWKDIPTGIAAVRRAHQQGLATELVRVSPTPRTAAETEAWGDLPVEWHESVDPAAMPGVYRSCDVFLGPAAGGGEPFCRPALEAMSCGLPIVVADVPCFDDYDHDAEFATRLPPGDVTAFATALLELRDVERRHYWRSRSLEVSRRHSLERHTAALVQAYQALVPAGQARAERGRAFDPHLDLPPGIYQSWTTEHTLRTRAAQAPDATEAIRLLESVAATRPHSAGAWNGLARAHLESGDYDSALAAIDRCLQVDPHGLTARRLRGVLHLRQHAFGQAIRDLDAAIQAGHLGANIYLELTLALLGVGDVESADLALTAATRFQPFDDRARSLIAEIDATVGEIENAR